MKNQKNRSMKVYSQNGRNYKATPTIILKGQWLEEMGFAIGDYISVSCENGKLVITPDTERAELEQMKADFMEKETKKLRKRFQREKEELARMEWILFLLLFIYLLWRRSLEQKREQRECWQRYWRQSETDMIMCWWIRHLPLGCLLSMRAAADEVVITVNPQLLAMMGLQDFLRTVGKIKKRINPKLTIAGILLTMCDGRTTLCKVLTEEVTGSFQGQIKIFKNRIPSTVKVGESIYYSMPIALYSKKASAGIAYRKFAKELIDYEGLIIEEKYLVTQWTC